MDEIEELKKQFELVQTQNFKKNSINERTCIEILYKLIEKKGMNLITTYDGETLLTKEYILNKVNESLNFKGRISIKEISKMLKISIEVILKLLKDIEKKYNYIFYKEDIMTREYINQIFVNINEELQDLHKISLISISEKNDLSIEFIRNEIKYRNNNINNEFKIKGNIVFESNNNGLLVSDTYLKSIEFMIKGCLLVSKKPVLINEILDIDLLDEYIIIDSIKKLLNKKWINGYLYENRLFIPKIYFDNEMKILKNYLIDNGYLRINKIKELLIYTDIILDSRNMNLIDWIELNLLDDDNKILLMNDEYLILSSVIKIIRENIIKSCFDENMNYIYINHLLPYILTNEFNINYCLDLINLFYKIDYLDNINIKWLFIFFNDCNSFSILNQDGSEYYLRCYNNEDNNIIIDNNNELNIFLDDNSVFLFISNFYLIINLNLIKRIQRSLYSKIELIIEKMILTHFYLLPQPTNRFGIKFNKKEIQDYNIIYKFITNIIKDHKIKESVILEIGKEWSDILNDNPIIIENNSLEDYIWNFVIRIISFYVVDKFNSRMKDIYDPSNISRTFHIQD